MDAIEKRALDQNPNVAVIHEAMHHFPEGSWMRGALDHAAAELAVLHGRCQRAALTPPEVSDTTQRLIELLIERDRVGRAKYGATLDRTDLTRDQWLQHMVEELLDGAGYALAAQRPGVP